MDLATYKRLCREGSWIRFRLPFLMVFYAVFSFVLELLNIWLKLIPQRVFNLNVILLLLNSFYCGIVCIATRTELKFQERKLAEAREELKRYFIVPAVLKLAALINYTDRPGIELLSYAAMVIYRCRELDLPCTAEIAIVESWIRFWDEEKVSQ